MKNLITLILCAFTIWSCQPSQKDQESSTNEPVPVDYLKESKADFDQRMQWWRDAKFGMFIHWGPYAVLAGEYNGKKTQGLAEWIMNNDRIPIEEYESYVKQFKPTEYDADQWMALAKKAGMKYVVITSKHHDGFGLWDSKVSSYDIVDFCGQNDALKALSEACKKHGVKLGFYHSIMDWHHPQAQAIHEPQYWSFKKEMSVNPEFESYLENYMKPQLKELITEYDPAILWFDGEWVDDFTHEQGLELYQYVRELKPGILINNRVDKGRQGMMGMTKEGDFAGDFGTPEQEIFDGISVYDWESCMTINDTWGYSKLDENWKSTAQLIHNLIDITAKGGNYLLNVGPTAKGLIPEVSIERLEQMGDWMAVNSEAIYNTERLNQYRQADSIRYTRKKGTDIYYAFKMGDLPSSVVFNNIVPEESSEIHLLGVAEPLDWSYTPEAGLLIEVPKGLKLAGTEVSRAWTFKIKGSEASG